MSEFKLTPEQWLEAHKFCRSHCDCYGCPNDSKGCLESIDKAAVRMITELAELKKAGERNALHD